MTSAKYPFLNRWFSDSEEIDASYFEKYIDGFLNQFDCKDMKVILSKMLDKYDFLTSESFDLKIRDYISSLNEEISNIGISNNYILTTPINDNGAHNSDRFFPIFKYLGERFRRELNECDIKNVENIIIVDDYSGSGNTVVEYLNNLTIDLNGKNVFFVPFMILEQAIEKLESETFKFGHVNLSLLKKVSTIRKAKYYSEQKIINDDEKAMFDKASKRVCGVDDAFINGYCDSQELLSLPYFTPNNTFGLFWYKNKYKTFIPLFEKNGSQIIHVKSGRATAEYWNVINLLIKPKNIKKRYLTTLCLLRYFGFTDEQIFKQFTISNHSMRTALKFSTNHNILSGFGFGSGANNYFDINAAKAFKEMGIKPTDNKITQIINNLQSLK